MTKQIEISPAALADATVAFKRLCVGAENGRTPYARTVLASLMTGAHTVATVTATVLAAFGNPKSPKGKVLDKLSGSGDHVTGFGAARKACADIFEIFANLESAPSIRATVTAFVLESADAPKSLAALGAAVKAAIAEQVKASAPAELTEAGEESATETEAATEAAPASTARPDIADMANRLALALDGATDAELEAALDAMAALTSRINALFEGPEAETEIAEAA